MPASRRVRRQPGHVVDLFRHQQRRPRRPSIAADPGRIGAWFHDVHVLVVAGVIVTAVGNELAIAHPLGHLEIAQVITLIAGPAIYLLGSALYRRIVYGAVPASHVAGLVALAVLVPMAYATNLLVMGWLTDCSSCWPSCFL